MFVTQQRALTALCLCLFASGCASNAPAQSTLVSFDEGVTCTKCQVVWVKVPLYGSHARIVRYAWTERDVCPDCMTDVQSFFATGKFGHTCKTCGDTMEICKAHPE